jgi:glycosyltransferase involved in cell wall biosynthesis
MGFSILIPVYNTYAKELVENLLLQSKSLEIPFEILLLDDCSELSISYINLKLNLLDNVNYVVLKENKGRSKVRNQLFEMAKYDSCLIMDGDVGVLKQDFLINYWETLQAFDVVVGGHKYSSLPPLQEEKYLHWLYGSKVESQTIEKRAKTPYASFKTVCFGIKKKVFQQIKFDEDLTEYGHEDTLFGIALEENKVSIKHIDNPVLHLGVDDRKDFLAKQKIAVKNLNKLYNNPILKESLKKKVRLIKVSENNLISIFSIFLKRLIRKNLYSKKPKLWALQAQKIIWWKEIDKY